MDLVDLADLAGGVEARVQAGVGLLEDHRDPVAAERVQLALAHRDEVDPVEVGAARHDPPRLLDEAQHRQHRDALAGTRLADEPEHLAAPDGEVDTVDRVNVAGARAEPRSQPGHLEERRRVDGCRFADRSREHGVVLGRGLDVVGQHVEHRRVRSKFAVAGVESVRHALISHGVPSVPRHVSIVVLGGLRPGNRHFGRPDGEVRRKPPRSSKR